MEGVLLRLPSHRCACLEEINLRFNVTWIELALLLLIYPYCVLWNMQ
jgi:hypothetical protein